MARNFVKRYGAEQFDQLMTLLKEGASGQMIADTFEVSRTGAAMEKCLWPNHHAVSSISRGTEGADEELGPVYDI